MIRIVFTGSESTGKSTLAAKVAEHYQVEVVPEFVRTFAEQKGSPIEFSDHGLIARGQMALEDAFIQRALASAHPAPPAPPAPPALPALPALSAPPSLAPSCERASARPRRSAFRAEAGPPALLIQDTDLLSTVVYCRHYFGRCPEWIETAARSRRPDLYLLCYPDVPWIADGIRDRGHLRDEMHRLFQEAVDASGAPSCDLTEDWSRRIADAIVAIDALLAPNPGR